LPLYEYRCLKCGTQFEKIRKFSDPPLTKCDKCGGKLELLLSPPAVQFKGSGWYVTDYARRPAPEEREKPTVESLGGKSAADKPAGSAAKSGDSSSKPSQSKSGSRK